MADCCYTRVNHVVGGKVIGQFLVPASSSPGSGFGFYPITTNIDFIDIVDDGFGGKALKAIDTTAADYFVPLAADLPS